MWLYYLMVFLFALQHHWLWSMQLTGTITLFKILGLVVLAYALIFSRRGRHSIPFWNRTTVIFGLLFTVAGFSYVAQGTELSSAPLQSYISMLSLVVTTFLLVDSWNRLRNTLLAILLGVAFGGLYVIREYQLYHWRPGWVVGNPNYYASCAVICLPIGLALLELENRKLFRSMVVGSLLITTVALTLTGSRGGFLALLVVLAFTFLRSSRWRKRIALATPFLLILVLFSPISPIGRLFDPSSQDESSVEYRKRLIAAGMEMIQQHPLMGVGLGNFKIETREMEDATSLTAHNTYIDVGAELGIPALFLFLGLVQVSWRNLNRTWRVLPRSFVGFRAVVLGLQGSIVGFMVSALFITAQYQRYFWLVVLLSAVTAVLAERSLRDRDVPYVAMANAGRPGHRPSLGSGNRPILGSPNGTPGVPGLHGP